MPTTARILALAPVAQYLASNQVAKGVLFGNRPIDPKLPVTIFMVYKILKRVYDEDPNYTGVREVALYLYELIQRYAFKAAAIVDGNTGGQIAPPTPGSGTLPNPFDWEVSAISTPLADGESSVVLSTFIGYNIDVLRGGVGQNTTNIGGSYFVWNRTTGLFQIFPAVLTGELIRITPIG